MSLGFDDAMSVAAVGTTVTSGAASASASIPVTASGARAKVIRLVATGNAYVKLGVGAATATANDIMLGANLDTYISCQAYDTIAYLQETAAAKINITPLEV